MELVISAISQALLWSLLSLGLFISFRILNIADMTTEGAYPLGAAVCVVLIQQGFSPLTATLIAMLIGSLAGLVTAILINVCKIPSLLAGILTMTALISVNLRIMKRPNLNLLNKETIFSYFSKLNFPPYFDTIFLGLIIISIVILLMFIFFNTELGQALIATGDNAKMATSLGISTKKMICLGLMLSNSMVALTGAILSQHNGYADVNSGLGVIVVALAAIIIGEIVFGDVNFVTRLVCIVFGSIIYRLLLVFVLKLNFIQANDFKLVSALMIAIFLSIPELKKLKGRAK